MNNYSSVQDGFVPGALGQAGYFDGADDYVLVNGLLGSPSDFTIAAWVDTESIDTGGAEVISVGDHFGVRLDESGSGNPIGFYRRTGDWDSTAHDEPFLNTGWRHIVYTMNDSADEQVLYVDGVVSNTTAYTGSVLYDQGVSTYIGRHANGDTSYDFGGSIDDARVYNRALSSEEVLHLYQLGN